MDVTKILELAANITDKSRKSDMMGDISKRCEYIMEGKMMTVKLPDYFSKLNEKMSSLGVFVSPKEKFHQDMKLTSQLNVISERMAPILNEFMVGKQSMGNIFAFPTPSVPSMPQ